MRNCTILIALLCVVGTGAPRTALALDDPGTGVRREGPFRSLQKAVDATYGAGNVNVATDYIGARPTDPDPWFWLGGDFSVVGIRSISAASPCDRLGWYLEDGHLPTIDGVDDGVLFSGRVMQGLRSVVHLDHPMTKFGLYLSLCRGRDPDTPPGDTYFTNRLWNEASASLGDEDRRPRGGLRILVFDVSRWTQPDTWLVCFTTNDENSDSLHECDETGDGEFHDALVQITALGATPARPLSFGALKSKYR
jgi:hypothetical protein